MVSSTAVKSTRREPVTALGVHVAPPSMEYSTVAPGVIPVNVRLPSLEIRSLSLVPLSLVSATPVVAREYPSVSVAVPETVVTLAEIDNVVGMKDSSANLIQTMKYIDATRDMDFSVLVGNDASIFATMLSGGKGAVAATANVAPALIVGIYDAIKSDRRAL